MDTHTYTTTICVLWGRCTRTPDTQLNDHILTLKPKLKLHDYSTVVSRITARIGATPRLRWMKKLPSAQPLQ